MKKWLFAILFIFLFCLSIACQKRGQETAKAAEANRDTDVAAIKALIDVWVQLYNAGDFDKLVSVYYAENAILMSPDMPLRKGKEAIRLGYQKDSELNDEHVDSSVAEEVRVSGDLAAAWGRDTGISAPRKGGKPVKYYVDWLMVFERQSDRTWKCIHEMWNDHPLPETPEKKQQD